MMHSKVLQAFYLFVLLAIVPPINADWINLTGSETAPTIAEIYVMDDHVRLVLEVYVGALKIFEDLVPDDWLNDKPVSRLDEAARIRRFAEERFQFITGSGEQLLAEVVVIEPRERVDRRSPFAGMINPFTRQRVPRAPADKRVLYAEMRYPFDGKPGELTMVPPLDAEGHAEASIGFIVYHKSVPVIDFRYLGAPAKLSLDGDDPWYSKFDNPDLKRHHKSALMSFLYVEPYEVRHEILTRVRDLEEWMDPGLRGDEYIIQKAGGAQAKIKSVEIEAATAERLDDRPLACTTRARWAAQGTVGHWGHIHTRRNRYVAIVTVAALGGAWKISGLEILGEQRVGPAFGTAVPSAPGQPAAAS